MNSRQQNVTNCVHDQGDRLWEVLQLMQLPLKVTKLLLQVQACNRASPNKVVRRCKMLMIAITATRYLCNTSAAGRIQLNGATIRSVMAAPGSRHLSIYHGNLKVKTDPQIFCSCISSALHCMHRLWCPQAGPSLDARFWPPSNHAQAGGTYSKKDSRALIQVMPLACAA